MATVAIQTATVRQMQPDESQLWDDFVSSASNGNILQSWGWGEFKRKSGWQPVRIALMWNGRIQAGAQVLIRSVAGLSLAYVPRGPVAPMDQPDVYSELLNAIHRLARNRHCVFLKIEPNEADNPEFRAYLRQQGFIRSLQTMQPAATFFIDLHGEPDEVLARRRKKTRQYIRLAERRGVQVRFASSDDDVRCFHKLMVQTGERGNFPVRSFAYYRDLFNEFHARDQGRLLLVEVEGQVVAGLMVFAFGMEGVEIFGAWDHTHSQDRPNYLMRWRALQWFMERGCTRYDLWGVPEEAITGSTAERDSLEKQDSEGGLWGVYEFKRRFADVGMRYIGAYDYPYIRPLYLFSRHRLKGNRTTQNGA